MFGFGSNELIVIVVFPLVFLLFILSLLMPWFIYRIKCATDELEKQAQETNRLLGEIAAKTQTQPLS